MKKNKGFAPVLITIAVLAILMAGGIAYYTVQGFKTGASTQIKNYPSPQVN